MVSFFDVTNRLKIAIEDFGQQCTITGMWLTDIVFHEQGHTYCPELLSCALLNIEILFLRIVVILVCFLAVFNFGNLTKTTLPSLHAKTKSCR